MANYTQEEIADAFAATVESIEGEGTCITDRRFTENRSELLRLLKSQIADGRPLGSILSLQGIPQQVEDSPCDVIVTYAYTLAVIHPYENDAGSESSDVLFKRRLFSLNEGLNNARDLGLDVADPTRRNLVRHRMLQSNWPFSDILEWGEASEGEVSHYTEFDVLVDVINTY